MPADARMPVIGLQAQLPTRPATAPAQPGSPGADARPADPEEPSGFTAARRNETRLRASTDTRLSAGRRGTRPPAARARRAAAGYLVAGQQRP